MELSEVGTCNDIAADEARADLAATLDEMVGPGIAIRVHFARDGDRIAARFSGPRVTPKLPPDVRLHAELSGLTLLFPARARDGSLAE